MIDKTLWAENTPQKFWRPLVDFSTQEWQKAIVAALPELEMAVTEQDWLYMVLGEGQYGPDHWQLSFPKQIYYMVKPLLPRFLTRLMRRYYKPAEQKLAWPIEDRYSRFLWKIVHQLMVNRNMVEMPFIAFWPQNKQFSFVLTHDIETIHGQSFVRNVMQLEKNLGFRSSFNFIPERYPLDYKLMEEIKQEGFEIGVHGLNHDGKLFSSEKNYRKRSDAINNYIKKFGAQGFRTPLTHRNPRWMQSLEIEYDLSFFDTDPYEPIPGGTMSIWPFMLGNFIELPYTLVQDYSLVEILAEKSPDVWLKKLDFIEKYHGMALLNVHPDYLIKPENWKVYEDFLKAVRQRNNYWHKLPHEVAAWWKERHFMNNENAMQNAQRTIRLVDGELKID